MIKEAENSGFTTLGLWDAYPKNLLRLIILQTALTRWDVFRIITMPQSCSMKACAIYAQD